MEREEDFRRVKIHWFGIKRSLCPVCRQSGAFSILAHFKPIKSPTGCFLIEAIRFRIESGKKNKDDTN